MCLQKLTGVRKLACTHQHNLCSWLPERDPPWALHLRVRGEVLNLPGGPCTPVLIVSMLDMCFSLIVIIDLATNSLWAARRAGSTASLALALTQGALGAKVRVVGIGFDSHQPDFRVAPFLIRAISCVHC